MIQDVWPLFTSRTVMLEKRIPGASEDNTLSVLHDPNQVLHLSPLVLKVIQDCKDRSWFTMIEFLPLFGGLISTLNIFRCWYVQTEEGYDSEVRALLGTRLNAQMRAQREVDGKEVVVKEKVVIRALFFLMPFIQKTMTQAHVDAMDALAAKLTEKYLMIQDFWPLFLTRTVTLEKGIQGCTQNNALSILHDPEQVFQLSPLVYKIDHDGSWYTLTERLPLFGSYSTTNVYRCQYTKVEEGYDCDVRASLGTRLDVQMRACGEGKDIVVKEKVVVKALFFLMPYIISTMTKAHVESSDSLAARLTQKMDPAAIS